MTKHLCAFSSDFRSLYLGDIYRVLSLPAGSIIHFRYKTKYVDDAILNNIKTYTNRNVYIFLSQLKEDGSANNFSVRQALIKKIEKSQDTQLVHVYMALHNFVNVSLKESNNSSLLPASKYLSELEIASMNSTNWHDKIIELSSFFKGFPFFYLHSITTTCGKIVKVRTRMDNKRSYYSILQGNDYLLDLKLANPNNSTTKIALFSSSPDVSFNSNNKLPITAQFDDVIIPIHFRSLNVSQENSFISIGPEIEHISSKELAENSHSNIEIEKNIGLAGISFGVASLVAAISLWSLQAHISALYNINPDNKFDWYFIISAVTLLISSSYLFHKYNKK